MLSEIFILHLESALRANLPAAAGPNRTHARDASRDRVEAPPLQPLDAGEVSGPLES